MAVLESERERLALLHDPSAYRSDARYETSGGQLAVTFETCPDGQTQFNGGFVVEGRRSAVLDVWMEEEVQPERIAMSFGAGDCSG